MAFEILFAEKQDQDELNEILLEYGMGIPGGIEEQLIVKDNDRVVAGAKIVEVEKKHFYLEVLGVEEESLGQGIGRILMTEIAQNPWKCCKNPISEFEPQKPYIITTVARGYATGFYEKIGFELCSFLELPELYRDQCVNCPLKEDCEPRPMIFNGGI